MQYIVNHSVITSSNGRESDNVLFGSSKFKVKLLGELQEIQTKQKTVKATDAQHEPKYYKVNKQNVRNKIKAFAAIGDKANFAKFITVSFPLNFPDKHAKQALNTWLTTLRTINKSFEYIWIAERQNNGTLHFHIITKTWFNIKIINRHMAKSIQFISAKNGINTGNFTVNKYNGVDIKVIYKINDLAKYVTKYVTKNETQTEGYSSNCSTLISRLYTKLQLTESQFLQLKDKVQLIFTKIIPRASNTNNIEINIYCGKNGNSPPMVHVINQANEQILNEYYGRIKSVSAL